MTCEYGARAPGMPENILPEDIEGALIAWVREGKGWRRYRDFGDADPSPEVEFILTLEHWPGVLPAKWAEFKEAVRTSPPFGSADEERNRIWRERHFAAWQLRDPAGHANWKRDPAGYSAGKYFTAAELRAHDVESYHRRVEYRRLGAVARETISYPGWKCDPNGYAKWAAWWHYHPIVWPAVRKGQAASAPPPTASAQSAGQQQQAQGEKLFQRILRMAFYAVSPDKAPVLAEAVRAKFREAYPQGKDTSAKQAASAVRKAWSRALQFPPVGIAVDGGYISATPA